MDSLHVDNHEHSVTVGIPAEKLGEWILLLEDLASKPLVSKKTLQKFTGKMSWASGIIPQLRPFTRMLFAAMSHRSQKTEQLKAVYLKQIEPALNWIRPLLHGFRGGLTRKILAWARHDCKLDFYTDASPHGGGAVRLHNGQPVECLSLKWSRHDEIMTGAHIGDPGSQALWEGYMLLRALWHWLCPGEQGFIRVRGDAQGVLAAVVKRAAISPLLNNIVREIALVLAADFTSIEALHVWSEDNEWADALSRGVCPFELASLPQSHVAQSRWSEDMGML